MTDRGEYRSCYTAMADDADIHAMSPRAFKLFWMLKLSLPATGIGVIYTSKLADQVGASREEIEQLLVELEAPKPGRSRGWIVRERSVVWIVNALACEPNLVPTNVRKHVPYVRRLVAQLDPSAPIVKAFKERYLVWFDGELKGKGNPTDRVSIGNANPIDRVSTPSNEDDSKGIDRVSIANRNNSSSSALHSSKQTNGDLSKERAPATAAPLPLASAFAQLPEDAQKFVRQFYPRATISRERREDIARQIIATLHGGTPLRRGEIVFAHTPERLAAKCRAVIDEGVKDPDKAIVVLLVKLNDTSDLTEGAALAAQQTVASEEHATARELAAADTWLEDHALLAESIEVALDADGFTRDETDPFQAICRRFARTSRVLEAWRQAGAPLPAEATS